MISNSFISFLYCGTQKLSIFKQNITVERLQKTHLQSICCRGAIVLAQAFYFWLFAGFMLLHFRLHYTKNYQTDILCWYFCVNLISKFLFVKLNTIIKREMHLQWWINCEKPFQLLWLRNFSTFKMIPMYLLYAEKPKNLKTIKTNCLLWRFKRKKRKWVRSVCNPLLAHCNPRVWGFLFVLVSSWHLL